MISPVKIWRRQKEIRGILQKKGKIVTWTKVYVAGPAFKSYAPYVVILAALENGKRAVGQLVDHTGEGLKIGDPVVATLRKVRRATDESVIAYGVKFKLL